MSDNLKVAKECGIESGTACTKDGQVCFYATKQQLEAYTSRILASQQAAHEAEIARLKEEYDELDRHYADELAEGRQMRAACAMKDEALKAVDEYLTARVSNSGIVGRTIILPKVKGAISASPNP